MLISNKLDKFHKFLKKKFMNSDFLIVRRVIQVGAINTIVGPLILILFQYFLNDLVLSFFLNSIFMIFFKFYMYKKIAFRDIKSKRAYLLPITLPHVKHFTGIIILL